MNPFLDPLLTNIMQYPQSTSGSPASSVPRFSSPLRTSTSEQAASVEQQLQQQQQQQQSGFPTYNPLGTTQRIEASGQLGSGRPSPRLITAGLSSGSHSSRPRSAVNRHPSPAALQPYRRRYNSISSLPPIQSASFNTMPAEWNEPCLLFAQDSSTYDYSHRNEDRQALGLSNGSAQMPPTSSLGLSQDFFGDQSQYNNMFETSNPMQSQPSQPQQSRPYLALDIQQTFGLLQSQQPPSAQSSNLPSSVPTDPASISDGERIITPGMFSGYPNVQQTMNNFQSYGDATQPTWDLHQQSSFSSYQQQFQPSTEQYQQNAFQQQQQMQYFQQMTQSQPQQQQYQYDQNLISAQLAQQLQQVLVPHPHQGTISPSQLSQDTLKPISSSGRLFDIPCSSSSASSTDGGDWQNPSLNPRDTWSRSIQSAIPHRPASQNELSRQSSLARSSPVGNSTVSDTSHTMSMGNEYVQSESSQSIPSTRPTYHPDPSDLEGNLRQYLSTSNRLSFGERKIIVMSPKVGQKSYGNEKRFLCPPPQAVLIGAAWWTESPDGCPISPMLPPKVNVSIAGEQSVKDAAVNWLSIHGDSLDEKLNVQAIKASDLPFVGHVAGKNLHITDADGKRREVKALVTVKAPDLQHAGKNGWGHGKGTVDDVSVNEVVGTFESKEIKIISKPSKKKSNTKSNDLLITHGSTVALFNRIKSQTLSTRFLAADLDSTKILGSDGLPVSGARPPRRGDGSNDLAGFVPHQNTWESWIVWLVDPSRPEGPGRNAPLHPDWPVAPANALHTPHHAPPIRYNQTVVLQSLQTGICSPIMIVRRIESDSDAVGGDGTAGDSQTSVREGEWAGDYVSQLQKVAFERYRPDTMFVVQTDPRWGGSWLACDQDVIFERKVTNTRKWSPVPPAPTRASSKPSSVPSTPSSRFGVLPMTPHTNSVNLPSTPSSPVSASSSMDYFGAHSRKQSSSSLVMSPNSSGHIELPMSTDGGPVRRQRTGSNSRNGPLARPTNHKRRQSTEINSANSSYEHVQSAANSHNQQTVSPGDKAHQGRMFWTMSVGDMAVWTIVSTEQVSYTFYIPHSVATLPSDRKAPIAPFPTISRMLGPKQMTEMPATVQRLHSSGDLTFTPRTELPLVTVYGKGFVKTEGFHAPHLIYWGDQKAVHNEVRCTEVMAASEPVGVEKPTPVFLVREDGLCIIPTGMQYP